MLLVCPDLCIVAIHLAIFEVVHLGIVAVWLAILTIKLAIFHINLALLSKSVRLRSGSWVAEA